MGQSTILKSIRISTKVVFFSQKMKILFILACLFQMGFQKPQIPKHIGHDYASELNENIQGRIAAKAILEGIAANAGTRALNKAQGKDYFIGGILKALLSG